MSEVGHYMEVVARQRNEIWELQAEVEQLRKQADEARRYLASALDSLGELPDEEPSNTAAYIMSAQMALGETEAE